MCACAPVPVAFSLVGSTLAVRAFLFCGFARHPLGSFTNDRPQGFGDWSEPSGDPAAPVEHRLEVYQRGKPICFLDELVTGANVG